MFCWIICSLIQLIFLLFLNKQGESYILNLCGKTHLWWLKGKVRFSFGETILDETPTIDGKKVSELLSLDLFAFTIKTGPLP